MTADEFRAALSAAGYTQRTIAEALGVHPVTARRWATGALPVPGYVVAYLQARTKAS